MSLSKYPKEINQEHLLKFYNELSLKEKINLKKEIKSIDFNFMSNLYKNSYYDEDIDINKISPLKCIDSTRREDYIKEGESLVKSGSYAIVIMAGGNASRLGLNAPKGCLELNISNKKISLFEMFINQLKDVYNKYKVYIRLYIMTSNQNNKDTLKYFKEHNYFGYPNNYIKFFIQEELPLLSKEGMTILKDKSHVLFGPNGNGNVFKSLSKNNLINDMKNNNIKYVLFSTVDNALANLVDYNFIGSAIQNNYEVATKTIFKNDELDKEWIFCKYDNHPYMLESRFINKDITNMKDKEGKYLYREKNITYHLVSLKEIIKYSKIDLKYHRAYKKYDRLDDLGNKKIALENNTFKFEQFIFDAFYYSSDMLLYQINEEEFCPIKTKEDIKKVENLLNK